MLCLFERTIRGAVSLITSKTSNSASVKLIEQDTTMFKKMIKEQI